MAGAPESPLSAYRCDAQVNASVFPSKESGMSGAPALGAANGPPNRKTPSDRTSGDAKTVLTTPRLVRSSLRSASGPVDSPHPAVSTSTIQVIGLMRLDLLSSTPHASLDRVTALVPYGCR